LSGDKVQRTPMEAVSVRMLTYGTMLGEESVFGKTLVKCGTAHDKLALEQLALVSTMRHSHFKAQKIREGFLHKLQDILEDQKEYEYLKRKLENRRLDFDAKLNQVQKTKKEQPKLEEETRVAQGKYEETLTSLTNKMIEINSNEVSLLGLT